MSIASACYTHDKNYGADSTMDRSEADWILAMDIYKLLVAGGVGEGAAAEAAMIYHAGVRLGGVLAYEGQGNPW